MKVLKWVGVALVAYCALVFAFEVLYLGWYQPKLESMPIPMLVITSTDDSGGSHTRRVARLDSNGSIYVSAHHWPRSWYHRAVENPGVVVEVDGAEAPYLAVPVDGQEFERVAAEYPLPLPIRFLMGFPPPREILRLDPATRDGSRRDAGVSPSAAHDAE